MRWFLLAALQESENLEWSDPWLQAIDLEYHHVEAGGGLFGELVAQGAMRQVVSAEEVQKAIGFPPATTRAFFRGRSVARFPEHLASIQWDEIRFEWNGQQRRVPLPEVCEGERLAALNQAIVDAPTIEALFARLAW